MGIVVTIIMLLGLGALIGTPSLLKRHLNWVAAALLVGGLWNAVWYGAQHLNQFWGQAALVSGLFMLGAAYLLLLHKQAMVPNPVLKWVVVTGLVASISLYAITLIQLNLGMPIIR